MLPQCTFHLQTPSSAPLCSQSYLNSFLNLGAFFLLSTMIEQSHFIVKKCQFTLIFLILSYPGMVVNDVIKRDACLLLLKFLSVCSFQPYLLSQGQTSSVGCRWNLHVSVCSGEQLQEWVSKSLNRERSHFLIKAKQDCSASVWCSAGSEMWPQRRREGEGVASMCSGILSGAE